MMASIACLMHCIALPMLVAFLPSIAILLGITETLHVWIFLFAVPTSLFAIVPFALRTGNARNLGLACAGLASLGLGMIFEDGSVNATAVTSIGSFCLGFAHFSNWKLRRSLAHNH